ncbi:hypothetical protein EV426DRAFT_200311 [Tirmania nivea]|nr:hypothetical protein EV426DRAFT_200311 [Tirmania nivea]
MAQPHRGLPPPAAMTLPTAPPSSSVGPIPSHLWQNSDDTVRSLLNVKAQELQHAAEQERTKQEEIKLRRREAELRIRETELSVIREAIQGGMTGPSLGMIFGQNSRVTEIGNDWDYRPQSRAPPPTPELRRETRLIGPAVHSSAPHPPQAMPPPAPGPSWDTHQPGFSSYHAGRGGSNRSSQSAQSQPAPQPPSQGPPHRSLPRISTNEVQTQKSSQLSGPTPVLNPSPMPHPGPQSSTTEAAPVTQSPGIYFHHWQPPSTQVGSQASAQRASSPQRQLGSPFPHHHPTSHLSGSEVSSSPKRRKTTSGQPYSPPSYQAATGPGSSVTPARRRAHSRQRSDTYTAGMRPFESHNRPTTRQRRADTISGHGDERSVGPPAGEPMQMSPDAGSGSQQQGSGQEQGGVPLPAPVQQQQQQQQPPSRPYSAGLDRSRDLPYPGPPGSEGGQPPQGGNGRH